MAHVRRHPVDPNKWQTRYIDPHGVERSKTFDRKVDAEDYGVIQEAAKIRGEWVDPRAGNVTFAEWSSRVVAGRVHLRPSTRARDESVMRNLVLPHLGQRKLKTVDPAEIQAWVAGLLANGKAPATGRKAYQLSAVVFDSAVDSSMIQRTPCHNIKLPRVESPDMHFLTPAEIFTLADQVPDRYRVLILTAGFTGMRWGEVAGLHVDQLDMLRRSITVSRQLSEVKGRVDITEPKTKTARRRISLPPFLVDELAAHLHRYPPGDNGLVFTGPTGHPLRRTNFRRRTWLPATRLIGHGELTFHDLRHSHVAMLIDQGEHPKLIASRLGHSSVRTVLDVYGHLFDGIDEAAADRLGTTVADLALTDKIRTRRPEHGTVGYLPTVETGS